MSGGGLGGIIAELLARARILAGLATAMWAVFAVNELLFGGSLNQFGIRPGSLRGLLCSPLSVFLHGDLQHLFGNLLGFLPLGGLILLRGVEDFWIVSFVAMLGGGIGTWLFGNKQSNHIGASGVIFGYIGFLLWRGYIERAPLSALMTILTLVSYTKFLWGVFPTQERVSWEGHLFGFIGGILAAHYLDAIKTALPIHLL